MHQMTVATVKRLKTFCKRALARIRIPAGKPLRIIVGSAAIPQNGWLATDIDVLDVTRQDDWERLFTPGSLQAILAEHVWEHLTLDDARRAVTNCFYFLRPGGYLRMAVPDGLHPDPAYIDMVRPGGCGEGASDHKVLFTYRTLEALLADAGLSVVHYEHFDEEGKFHFRPWQAEDGVVRRSLRFDPRNTDRQPHFTSIVLDAVKPTQEPC